MKEHGQSLLDVSQELRRSLSLWDLLAYGLVFIVPIVQNFLG